MASNVGGVSSSIDFNIGGLDQLDSAAAALERLDVGVTNTATAVRSLSGALAQLSAVSKSIKIPKIPVTQVSATPATPAASSDTSGASRMAAASEQAAAAAGRAQGAMAGAAGAAQQAADAASQLAGNLGQADGQAQGMAASALRVHDGLDQAAASARELSGSLQGAEEAVKFMDGAKIDFGKNPELAGAVGDAYALSDGLNSVGDATPALYSVSDASEQVAVATGAASSETRRMVDSQGEMTVAAHDANSSLANQRYALYDVADAFRGVSTVAGMWTAATVGTATMFQDQFSDVIRTVGLAGDEIGDMKDTFIDLSTVIPTAFGDLTEIGSLGGQLGIEKEGIEDFTRVVAQLGITTDLTTDSAAFMLGRFQTLLGTTPAEFEALASAVLAVGVDSVATETDIANLSIELAAVSQQAGLTAQDIVALSATLSSTGLPAERARSGIMDAFGLIDKAIRDNGEELRKWSELAGVSIEEFKASWGTDEFMGMFQSAMESISEAGPKASAVLEDLGVRNSRTEMTLLNLANATELMGKTLDLSYDGWSEATILTDQFGIKADTVASQMILLKNEALALFDVLGSSVVESPVFANILSIAQDATWLFRSLIDSVPGADLFVGAATAIITLTGALAGLRATKALVTAASFAMADAQTAMQATTASSARIVAGLVQSVFQSSSVFAQNQVVVQQSAATNTVLGESYSKLAAGASAATDAERLHGMAMQETVQFSGMSAAALGHETGFMTANTAATEVATATKKRWRDHLDWSALSALKSKTSVMQETIAMSVNTQVTGASAAAKRLYTASLVATQKAVNALIGSVRFLGVALKGVAGTVAFTAALEGLSWVFDKIRGGADDSVQAIDGMTEAIAQDTRAVENGEDAYLQMAVAMDDMGNVSHSVVARLDDGTDAMALQEQAINSLKAASDQDPLATLGAGQKDLKANADEATEAIKVQMFYMGQASMMKMWDSMEGSSFKELIGELQQLADLGNVEAGNAVHNLMTQFTNGTLSAEDFASTINLLTNATQETNDHLLTTGGAARVSAEDLDGYRQVAEEILGIDSSQFEKYLELTEASAKEFEEGSVLAGVFNEQLNEQGAAAAFAAYTGLDPLNAGLDEYNEGVDEAVASSFDFVGSQMAMADAMYALGVSLFENGTNFDIFTVAGRDNMQTLTAAVEAAVIDANGDAIKLAENIGVINAAMVANGMEAVDVLNMVMGIVRNVKKDLDLDFSIPQLGVDLKRVTPAFTTFGRSINEGYVDAMNRAREASKKGAKGMDGVKDSAKNLGKEAKKAAQEVRTLSDYVSDLSKVFDDAFDFRWGMQQSLDSTADSWDDLKDWAEDAADAIRDAKDAMQDAKDEIRDAKNELRSLRADMAGLKAEESTLEFHLKVALSYGDTLRAKDIEAELLDNRSRQADNRASQQDSERDIDGGQTALTQATKDLAKANQDAQTDLDGTTKSAREQREMVWTLLEAYQKQVEEYANTGASTKDLEQYTKRLRSEFEDQLTQLGYNQTEVKKYSGTFTDLTTVIKNVPRNITVSINADPAKRALDEYKAKLKTVDSALKNTATEAGNTARAISNAGSPNFNSLFNDLDKAEEKLEDVADEAKRLRDLLLYKNTGGYGGQGTYLLNQWLSTGGLVQDIPGGSLPPASRGTDTVPAMLTPGEFVIRKSAVDTVGLAYLERLNSSRGAVPASGSTYVNVSTPGVQLVELMPHQMNAIVSSVTSNVGRAMMTGADLSVATARANGRAVRAGAN